jgi:tetratricopeptide (TPR) repeat protein
MKWFSVLLWIICSVSYAQETTSQQQRKALLATIPKTSVRKLLLFATLYPHTEEGEKALRQAFENISTKMPNETIQLPPLFVNNITALAALSEPKLFALEVSPELTPETCQCIEDLGKNLPHKQLKGHAAQSLQQVALLAPEEIDLSRALLLLEQEFSPKKKIKMVSIESTLDLLALSVLARMGNKVDPATKIKELNQLLFDELALRFPPQSEADEKVKQFSELSSVLFSRRGVCLGASTLYLCLAQRIGLPLSIFTPPGHIFVGYKDKDAVRVIETTARGIEIPVDEYLGTSLRSLPERSMKEVIGMVAYNRASTSLKQKNWNEALSLYKLAEGFESDEELSQMIALTELLLDQKRASKTRAQDALKKPSPCRLEHDLMLIDLSKGVLSKKTAEIILETTDDEPDLLPQYIKKLEECLAQDPSSMTLPLHIAHCWFLYGKSRLALPYLEKAAAYSDAPSSVHFFLAELYESRMNYPAAWNEAKKAVLLTKEQGMVPEPLKKFILALHNESPNCEDLPNLLGSK